VPATIPVTLALVLAAMFYLRGWIHLRKAVPNEIPGWRAAAFVSGLSCVWIAVASPLAALDEELLSVHMVQHLLLMTAAPPLILLGAPVLPLLHGLPKFLMHDALGPLLRFPPLQRLGHVLAHPVFCWFAATAVLIGWHVPSAFALALGSEGWHRVEHGSFLAAGLLFWWPVIPSWPSASQPRWSIVLYLFGATLPCDALSAFLAFCDRVVYQSYRSVPRRFGISPLQDQECAGALMWVCVTFAYLVPAAAITIRLLSGPGLSEKTFVRPISTKLPSDG
jgi:cytochrome c oxidase assembly factor CtaG